MSRPGCGTTLLTQWTYARFAPAVSMPRMETGGGEAGGRSPTRVMPAVLADRSRVARGPTFRGWRGRRGRSQARDEGRKTTGPHLPEQARAAPPCMLHRGERRPSYSTESTTSCNARGKWGSYRRSGYLAAPRILVIRSLYLNPVRAGVVPDLRRLARPLAGVTSLWNWLAGQSGRLLAATHGTPPQGVRRRGAGGTRCDPPDKPCRAHCLDCQRPP